MEDNGVGNILSAIAKDNGWDGAPRKERADVCQKLTQEERLAVAAAIAYFSEEEDLPGMHEDANVLRNLLKRLT